MAERLTAYLREALHRPFVWGEHDCALFVAGAVEAVTGRDPGLVFRGAYDDEKGARRIIEAQGGLVQIFETQFAGILSRVEPERALVGVLETQVGEMGAVRSGGFWLVLPKRGLGRLRASMCLCLAAWG